MRNMAPAASGVLIDAYYGAWFFIPASVQVRSWLSLHHFGYHRSAAATETTPLFDFNVYPGADGNLIAHVYDATAMANVDQTSPVPVPVARWVHFEILFHKAADATGRITIWQDGAQILDIANDRHWELSVHRGSIHVLPS